METNHKRLLIWDFDGVLADSEHIWVEIWYQALIDARGITLTPLEVQKYLTGLSIKTKQEYLNAYFHADINDAFIEMTKQREIEKIEAELEPIKDVEQVLKNNSFDHCIATGGTMDLTERKLRKIGLWDKYIKKECCFTSELVKNGKPAPDLFLLAASTMGYQPNDCIVIEDSINGIKAGISADMKVIAFIGSGDNNNEDYAKLCRQTGAYAIAHDMLELDHILKSL